MRTIAKRSARICVLAGIAAFLAALVLYTVLFFGRSAYHPEKDFSSFAAHANALQFNPYAEQKPLTETTTADLPKTVMINNAPLLYDMSLYNRAVVLPFDLCYYASPNDSVPAITLRKGTTVYVTPSDGFQYRYIGYGFACWPDYDAAWRYGIPFQTTDYKTDTIDYFASAYYYVKTEDLVELYKLYDDQNKGTPAFSMPAQHVLDRSAQAKRCFNTIFAADISLYIGGKFDSPAMHKELILWW